MKIIGKIKDIVIALLMVIGAISIIAYPEYGFLIVVIILSFSSVIIGVEYLVYYFTMAIHMVGGKTMLFIGALLMELGAFTASLYNIPKFYILVYLALTYGFSGAVDVLRALEAKQNLAPSWRLKLIFGLISVLVAVMCFISIWSKDITVYVYGAGLIIAAATRVIRAFIRTDDVYIQA